MTNTVKIEMTQEQANYLHALLYGHVCGSGQIRLALDEITNALEDVTGCAEFVSSLDDPKDIVNVTNLTLRAPSTKDSAVRTRSVTRITSQWLDTDLPF